MTKKSQRTREHYFFLATENMMLHLKDHFQIQKQMIEQQNFVPESFIIRELQTRNLESSISLQMPKGEARMPSFDAELQEGLEKFNKIQSPLLTRYKCDDEEADDADDDWDEDEDEDWDEDEEDWDEDEDDWEDDEDEDWEDEDEDWEDDQDAE